MVKQHYYQILLLLGSLLIAPLHAADQKSQDDYKYQEEQQYASEKSDYVHGDLTFIDQEKDKINQKELQQGLINLSRRIKAKGGRKVYFFIGASGAGKSLSILALQGNKIITIKQKTRYDVKAVWGKVNNPKKSLPKAKFEEVKYVLPKDQVPVVGNACTEQTKGTYIYYPDPKKQQYKRIAFAETESFFRIRKATSARKCLSAISFFYAVKANIVGGLVLVIGKPELYGYRGKGLRHITSILQRYFAKAVSNKTIKQSVLVMITQVDDLNSYLETLVKFRQCIQFFYQEYYAETDNDEKRKNLEEERKNLNEKRKNLSEKYKSLEEERKNLNEKIKNINEKIKNIATEDKNIVKEYKNIEEEIKNLNEKIKNIAEEDKNIGEGTRNLKEKIKNLQEENSRLKLFFEMLLEEDVPKDKIGDINNFRLDNERFCFIFPWDKKSVQYILDNQLTKLKPIASNDLCAFDNPLSRYMQARIRDLSIQLNKAIQPLLASKLEIDRIEEKQLECMTNKKVVYQNVKRAEEDIYDYRYLLRAVQNDNTLEVVFRGSHYESLPVGWEAVNSMIDKCTGYKFCKAFQYRGQEPIYKIVATYGREAELSETHPFGSKPTSNFIAECFKITKREDNNGMVTWKAVTKLGRGIENDEWLLYHATKGKYRAQCDITFYALKRELIATQVMIKDVKKKIEAFRNSIDSYEKRKNDYNTLESEHKRLTKKWKEQRNVQIKAWKKKARMLQFFVNEILENGAEKALIKEHVKNFAEATRLKYFLPATEIKGNNQKNKPYLEKVNVKFPYYWGYYQPDADKNQLNDHQSADEVFDID